MRIYLHLTLLNWIGLNQSSFISSIQAGENSEQTPVDTTKRAGPRHSPENGKATGITGEVTSVDAKAGTLTVKAKDKETNLTADAKAKASLEKVKVGDMVKVSYTEKDGKMVASSIAKSETKAKTTKPEEKKSDMMEKK